MTKVEFVVFGDTEGELKDRAEERLARFFGYEGWSPDVHPYLLSARAIQRADGTIMSWEAEVTYDPQP